MKKKYNNFQMDDFYSSIQVNEHNEINVYVSDSYDEEERYNRKAKAEMKFTIIYCLVAAVVVIVSVASNNKSIDTSRITNQVKTIFMKDKTDIKTSNTNLTTANMEETKSDNYDSEKSDDKTSKVNKITPNMNLATEIGTIENNVYINKWLALKIIVPNEYSIEEQTKYNTYSDSFNQCMFYAKKDNGDSIVCQISDMQSNKSLKNLDEKKYLDTLAKEYKESGIDASIMGEKETVDIAGEKYQCAHYSLNVGGTNMIQSMYVRKIDDKMCTIIVTGEESNIDNNNQIVKKFEKY